MAGVNISRPSHPPAPSCEAMINQTKTLSEYYQGLGITGKDMGLTCQSLGLEKMCKVSKEEVRWVVNGFLCSGFDSRNLGPAALAAAAAAASALLYSRPDTSSAATTASQSPKPTGYSPELLQPCRKPPKYPRAQYLALRPFFRQPGPVKVGPGDLKSCFGRPASWAVWDRWELEWEGAPTASGPHPLLPKTHPLLLLKYKRGTIYLLIRIYSIPWSIAILLQTILSSSVYFFLPCISHHSLSAQYWPTS